MEIYNANIDGHRYAYIHLYIHIHTHISLEAAGGQVGAPAASRGREAILPSGHDMS